MKFEIEIKEEFWKQLDSNPAIQVLSMETSLSDETLLKLIQEKFPAVQNFEGTKFELKEGSEYFYGCMYLPILNCNNVSKYLFRTKDPIVYHATKVYSHKIDQLMR